MNKISMFCHSTQCFLLLFQVSPVERTARGTSMREAMWQSVATSRCHQYFHVHLLLHLPNLLPPGDMHHRLRVLLHPFIFACHRLCPPVERYDGQSEKGRLCQIGFVCVWYCFPAKLDIEFIFCRPGSKSWWKRCLWTNNEWNFNCSAVRSTSVKFKRHWLSKWNAVPTLAKCLICKSLARQGRSNLSLICVKLAWKMDFEELD